MTLENREIQKGWTPSVEMEPLHTQIKVRCPQCFQTFRVQAHEIHQSRPRFACTKCQTQFWLPFPEALKQKELIGFPISWIQTSSATFEEKPVSPPPLAATYECPSCGFHNEKGNPECNKCGVVFNKVLARNQDMEEGVRSTPALRQLWEKILSDFENDQLHAAFLSEAQKVGCLAYASRRYTQLQEAIGQDDRLLAMLDRVQVLIEPPVVTSPSPEKVKYQASPASQTSVKSQLRHWLKLSYLAMFVSVLLIIIGFFIPDGRNLIGVGAAMGFLVFAAMMSSSQS